MSCTTTDKLQSLIDTLNDTMVDATKHDSGNKAAGGRVRKALQEVVVGCRDLRKVVQDQRNTR